MDQIIDIATQGQYLSRERGFLKVSQRGQEIGRIPLDQIAGVIVHAHGTTWSNSLLCELAERGAPVVLCASNHAPKSVLLPIEGHHAQGARMRAQWQAKAPLTKQAWKRIVSAKVQMQAAALSAIGATPAPLLMMLRKITSGDSTNIEAQAARHYWPRMMGAGFRRRVTGRDANALLNYGYTVLRTASARAVVGAGLHPTIGLFHSNRSNAFALADDLMEPFRPIVDSAVRSIVRSQREARRQIQAPYCSCSKFEVQTQRSGHGRRVAPDCSCSKFKVQPQRCRCSLTSFSNCSCSKFEVQPQHHHRLRQVGQDCSCSKF